MWRETHWGDWVCRLYRPPCFDDENIPEGMALMAWWDWRRLLAKRFGVDVEDVEHVTPEVGDLIGEILSGHGWQWMPAPTDACCVGGKCYRACEGGRS